MAHPSDARTVYRFVAMISPSYLVFQPLIRDEVVRKLFCHIVASLLLPFIASSSAYCQSNDNYQPRIAGPSNEGQLALKGFVVPEGMSGKLAAAEPQMANPVAFTVTLDGRVIV